MKLYQLADIRTGYPFRSRLENTLGADMAVIQMKDIDDSNIFHSEGLIRISQSSAKGAQQINEGDLVFRSRGKTNTAALITSNLGPAILAAPMIQIRPHSIEPAYLQWFINLPITQAHLASMAEGTSLLMINKSSLGDLEVPVPPLSEQRRIVELAKLSHREQEILNRIGRIKKRHMDDRLMRLAKESR